MGFCVAKLLYIHSGKSGLKSKIFKKVQQNTELKDSWYKPVQKEK